MISDIPSISQGITTTAQPSSHGNDQHGALPASAYTKDSKEYQLALENHKKCLKESEKHQQEAHYAAQRIASEVAGFKLKPSTSTDLKPSANGTAVSYTHLDVYKRQVHFHVIPNKVPT